MKLYRQDYPEDTAIGRSLNIAEAYLFATDEQRRAIVALFPEEYRQSFLMLAGCHRMFRDPDFYQAMKQAMGEVLYNEMKTIDATSKA